MTDFIGINRDKKLDNILFFGLCMVLFITPLIFLSDVRGYKEVKDCLGQILIFMLFIIWVMKNKKNIFKINNLNKLLLLFIGLILISFIFTQHYYLSFLGLKKWLSYILVYVITVFVLKDIEDLEKVFYVLLGVGFLTGLFGIINFYGFHLDSLLIEERTGRSRVVSTFGNPNYLSSFLGPLLPLNLYLILTEKNRKSKIGLFTSIAVIYTVLLLARTRGVFLGLIFIVFFIVFCFKKYLTREYLLRKRKTIVILLVLIVVLTAIFSGDIPFSDVDTPSLGSRFKSDSLLSASNYRRIMMWLVTINMMKDSPITGQGIGTYEYMYPHYQKDFLAKQEHQKYKFLATRAYDAHNEYLQMGAEAGILVPIVFMVMLIYVAYVFFVQMPYENSKRSLLLIALGSSLLVIAIHSLVSFPLRLMQTGILFWFLLGLVNNFLDLEETRFEIKNKLAKEYEIGVKVLISCVLSVLIILTGFKFISDRKFVAGWESNNLKTARRNYQQAVKYNPYEGRTKEKLGEVYSRLGLYKDAHRQLNLAKKTSITQELYNEIGMVYIKERLYHKAILTFKKAIAFYPNEFNPYANLGLVNKFLAKNLITRQKIEPAVNRLGKSILYLEQAKTILYSDRREQKESGLINISKIDGNLTDIVNKLFSYIDKTSKKQLTIDYKFYAPQNQLPIIDTIKSKAVGGQKEIVMFVYTNGSYQSLLKEYGIFNQKNNLARGISDFREYLLSNVRILKFKVEERYSDNLG